MFFILMNRALMSRSISISGGWVQTTIKLAHGMPPIDDENLHRAVSVLKKMVGQKTLRRNSFNLLPWGKEFLSVQLQKIQERDRTNRRG